MENIQLNDTENELKAFKEKFVDLLKSNDIQGKSVIELCFELEEKMNNIFEQEELLYLYILVITDCGLLISHNDESRTQEQDICCYNAQKERTDTFFDWFKRQKNLYLKLKSLIKSDEYVFVKYDSESEKDILMKSVYLKTWNKGENNDVYSENLDELIRKANICQFRVIKPFIYFAVLSRKHTYMLKRDGYSPDFENIFTYEQYKIHSNNGKNYLVYGDYVALYMYLRNEFSDDYSIDTELSDFCFANLCNLSEWYYRYCEIEESVSVSISQRVYEIMPESFPYITPSKNIFDFDIYSFCESHQEIDNKFEETLKKYPQIFESYYEAKRNYNDTSEYCCQLCEKSGINSIDTEWEQYLLYAESFLHICAMENLERKFIDISKKTGF